MNIQEWTQEKRTELLQEIINRTTVVYEDICVGGSIVFGCERTITKPTNFLIGEKEIILYPSDIDVLVWSPEVQEHQLKNDRSFIWDDKRVNVKFKPVSKKHSKFNFLGKDFLLPQYSLINNVLMDLEGNEINAYLDLKTRPPSNWAIGRSFDSMIVQRVISELVVE